MPAPPVGSFGASPRPRRRTAAVALALLLAPALSGAACAGARQREAAADGGGDRALESRLVVLERADPREVAIALRYSAPEDATIEVLDLPGLRGLLLRGRPESLNRLESAARRSDR